MLTADWTYGPDLVETDGDTALCPTERNERDADVGDMFGGAGATFAVDPASKFLTVYLSDCRNPASGETIKIESVDFTDETECQASTERCMDIASRDGCS